MPTTPEPDVTLDGPGYRPAQRYTDPRALQRMAEGGCPECGHHPARHTGTGGPAGCALTDNGVAQRLDQFRRDLAASGPGPAHVGAAAGRVLAGVQSFADDMRQQGIHVGLGSPGCCVTCGAPWPCEASQSHD